MIEIKAALAAKLLADPTLTGASMLNGEHVYQVAGDYDSDQLQAWVTFYVATQFNDPELGRLSQLYQFDVWARESDRGDAIAARISTLLGWSQSTGGGTLSGLSTRRLAEPVYEEPTPGDQAEQPDNRTLHHKVRQFRVTTYPA